MENIIRLRAHHLLCSQFFTGNGYNSKFTHNMTSILKKLNSDNPIVKIAEHCDDICSCCPKRCKDCCENEENVCNIDKSCMNEYGFEIGDESKWYILKSKVISKIKADNALPELCSDCSWNYICKSIDLSTL